MSVNNLMNNIFDAKFGEIKDSITNNSQLIESNKTRLDTHLLNYGVFKQDVEEGKYNSNAGSISSMPSVVAPDISVTGNSLYTFFDEGFVDIPFINNGGAATKWTIEPAIGNGLTFDTSTGNIRGTAIGTLPVTVYSITAENSAGLSKTTIQIDILDKGNIMTTPVVKTPQYRITEINAELMRFRGMKERIEVLLNQMGSIEAFCSQRQHYIKFDNSKDTCISYGKGMHYDTKKNLNNQIQRVNDEIQRLEIEKNELEDQNKTTVMSNTNPSITQLDINNTLAAPTPAPAPETAMGVPDPTAAVPNAANINQLRESFTNYNNTKQSSNYFQGVNVNKLSQLSGSEFQSDKKELVLDLEKDETGNMMSFLLQQNNMNKQVGKKELEEALEKDTEKVVETEGFSNYKSVELDPVSTFYVGSLSVIMLYYIYRSLRK